MEPDNNLVEIYVPCMKKEEGESEHSEVDDNLEELAGAVVVPQQVTESLEQVAAKEKRKKKKKKKSKDKEINATIDSINDSIEVFAVKDPDGAAVELSEQKEKKKKKKKKKDKKKEDDKEGKEHKNHKKKRKREYSEAEYPQDQNKVFTMFIEEKKISPRLK